MRTVIVFFVVVIVGCSCATSKRCNKKFPPHADSLVTVITRDTIIYRDSLVAYYLPGEVRIDTITIPCPPPAAGFIPDTARAETQFATAKAWWKYPYIRLKLEQRDTSLLLKVALKEAHHWRSEYEKITKVPDPIKYIPQVYKVCLWICIVIFSIGLIYIVYRVAKLFMIPKI